MVFRIYKQTYCKAQAQTFYICKRMYSFKTGKNVFPKIYKIQYMCVHFYMHMFQCSVVQYSTVLIFIFISGCASNFSGSHLSRNVASLITEAAKGRQYVMPSFQFLKAGGVRITLAVKQNKRK